MVNVILSGAYGAMGQAIAQTGELNIVCGVDLKEGEKKDAESFPVFHSFSDIPEKYVNICDCVIDFSHYTALPQVIAFAQANTLPCVIGTTGLSDLDITSIEKASKSIPIVQTANMSQGINAILQILPTLAKSLYPDFDVELIEKHHNRKKDAPSGTALLLADEINKTHGNAFDYTYSRVGQNTSREKNEIGISSIRGGSIPGEHTVIFAGEDEIIEVKHTALSRRIFALGAIRAAQWVVNQPPGYYTMINVLSDNKAPTAEILDEQVEVEEQ